MIENLILNLFELELSRQIPLHTTIKWKYMYKKKIKLKINMFLNKCGLSNNK